MSLTTVYLIGAIVCVFLSGFFSSAEMSLSSCNRTRVEGMAEKGDRKAKLVLRLLDHYDSALSTILLGNNLVNIAASSFATMAAIRIGGTGATGLATVYLTVAVIIFGDTIPKILSQKNATKYSLRYSSTLETLVIITKPFTLLAVKFVNLVTRLLKRRVPEEEENAADELHSIIETAEDEDVLDEQTSDLISAAIDFSDISAQEVMTARANMVALDMDLPEEEVYEIVSNCGHSRIPVYRDGLDQIVGILNASHYLKRMTGEGESSSWTDLLIAPVYVYKTMKLPAALSAMQAAHQQLAIVSDDYGDTIGVITVEDIMEELVGEIWDETDTVNQMLSQHEDGSWDVDGDLLFDDFAEEMGWDEESYDFDSDTVGGWCIEMLGRFPEENETFTYRDHTVQIEKVKERRVHRIHVTRNS